MRTNTPIRRSMPQYWSAGQVLFASVSIGGAPLVVPLIIRPATLTELGLALLWVTLFSLMVSFSLPRIAVVNHYLYLLGRYTEREGLWALLLTRSQMRLAAWLNVICTVVAVAVLAIPFV